MATIKLLLNRARQLNDGTYPLVIQIIHRRKKHIIATKVYIYTEEFDTAECIVKPSPVKYRLLKEIRAMNLAIKGQLQLIEAIVAELDGRAKPYTCEDIVRKYLHSTNDGGSLATFWRRKICELEALGKYGLADAQRSSLNSVMRFTHSPYLAFRQINKSFVRAYEHHLLTGGMKPNSVCFYIRNFKSIYKCAVKEKIIPTPMVSPFEDSDSRPKKTVKRALSREKIRELSELTFVGDPATELVRDLFLFSFYTRGMPFVDIVSLRKADIKGNQIHYTRRKTGQPMSVTINEPIRALIDKHKNVSHYIFPMLRSVDDATAYKEYRASLRMVNSRLKSIGKRIALDMPLTTYVPRHSWATAAKECGASVTVISEGLGHTSEKTTQIYLKEFDQSVLDRVNDMVSAL